VGATNNTQLQDSVKQDSLGQELKDPPVSTNVETSPKGRERKTRPRNAETEGTRLPKDWQPASTTLQWFHDKDYGTYLDLDETVTEFRNYWHNLPEKNKKPTPYKLDWEATFQNRIIALVKPLRENRQARASPQPQSKQARIEANNLQAHYGFLEMMEREDHERQRQKKL
jgi:hypothetical protein